jgi:hypothetical protein
MSDNTLTSPSLDNTQASNRITSASLDNLNEQAENS